MNYLRRRLKIIDAFIIGKYLGTFLYTLVLFVVIIVIFDLSEKLDDFLENNLSIWEVVSQYYAGSVPYYVNMLSPLINFIAVIFFTAKMADQTEIVPILSGGASFNRFLRPYFISAFIIFSLHLFSNLFVLPYTNRIYNKFLNEVVKKDDPYTKSNIHMRLDSNTYIYIGNFDNRSNIGYRFNLDRFSGDQLREKLVAETIQWDSLKRKWTIHNYSVRYVDGMKERLVSMSTVPKDTTLDVRPNDFSVYDNIYESMTNHELSEKIDKEKTRGAGIMSDLLFEQYKRWFQPLSAFVLTIIGVALSSRKVRGGVGLPLGIGIILSFIYIVLNHFAKMFSTKGGLPPLAAVLLPTLFFTILGLYLLRRAPK